MKNKIGLMLAGGGAKGAYQLGVIKALEEKGLTSNIQSVSGTSIGSINALLFMVKRKYSYMEEMWKYMDKEYVFAETRKDHKGVYNIQKLVDHVTSKIPLKNIRKSKVNGYATACKLLGGNTIISQLNMKNMEVSVFNLNTVKEPFKAILASASIPLIFGYTEIDGQFYVDGGLLDNYPVKPLLDDNCNIILSVPIDPRFDNESYEDRDILHIDFGSNAIFHKNFFVDLADAVKFNKKYEEELLLLGYNAAKKVIKKCVTKGLLIRNKTGRWVFSKPKGYTYVALSMKEEKAIVKVKEKLEIKRKLNKKNKNNASDVNSLEDNQK
ncbi:patatin-like phospholipase family protein [Acholeplasma sp. OttesenSCG-928-E16]|nr:patatin-like phospholipase family protein [Acholeplasma sp. OttesenSCG-928-E16]